MSPRDLDKPRKRRGRKRIIWKPPYRDMPLRLRYSFSGNFNITCHRKNYVLNLLISEYALNTFQLRGRSEQLWDVGLRLVTHEEPPSPSFWELGWMAGAVYKRERLLKAGDRWTKKDTQNGTELGLSSLPDFLSSWSITTRLDIPGDAQSNTEKAVIRNFQTAGVFASFEQRIIYRLILSWV